MPLPMRLSCEKLLVYCCREEIVKDLTDVKGRALVDGFAAPATTEAIGFIMTFSAEGGGGGGGAGGGGGGGDGGGGGIMISMPLRLSSLSSFLNGRIDLDE